MAVDIARFLSGIESPVARVQQGITFGQQQVDRRAAQQAAQAQAEQQRKVQADLLALAQKENRTADDFQDLIIRNPGLADTFKNSIAQLNVEAKAATITEATNVFAALSSGNTEAAINILESRKEAAENTGDQQEIQTTEILIQAIKANPDAALTSAGLFLAQATGPERFASTLEAIRDRPGGAEQQAFQALTKDLSPEDAERATRVKLGLEPRAVGAAAKTVLIGGVPHIFDPVTKEFVQATVRGKAVTAETVGEAKGIISGEEARRKGRVTLSNKVIDKGFATIGNINANIRNIDRALDALSRGAKTGAIQRFLPNITKASVELGQIQKELGLDIVSAVTFGALSKGELDLALGTALPIGLSPPDLTDFLTRKKSAQEKLRDYYRDQIEFLDGGGTVAEFSAQQRGQDVTELPTELPEGTVNNGDGTFTLPDGTIVEPE